MSNGSFNDDGSDNVSPKKSVDSHSVTDHHAVDEEALDAEISASFDEFFETLFALRDSGHIKTDDMTYFFDRPRG